MKTETKIGLTMLLVAGLIIGMAYAGTVGVDDLFGFDNIRTDVEYFRRGVNYTQFIASRYGSDQSLNTTDPVTFDTVTSGEYFLNAVNKTDIFAYPQQDYSYTVWVDGGTYYAKNGTTGAIDFSGTNASTIIQNTINACTARGSGTVYLKEGTYSIKPTVELAAHVALIGAGVESTILDAAVNLEDNVLEWTPSGAGNVFFAYVGYLKIIGNAADTNGHGIYSSNVDGAVPNDLHIEHVFVTTCAEDGLFFDNNWGYKITNCLSETNNGNGIRLGPGGGQAVIDSTFIAYNKGSYGLRIAASSVVVQGSSIWQNDDHGVLFQGRYNVFDDNIVHNNGLVGTGDGVWLDVAAEENIISNNIIRGNSATRTGMEIDSSRNILEGNRIFGCTGDGIKMNGLSGDNNLFTANLFTGNGGYDININHAGCENNTIQNNVLKSTTPFRDIGTNTVTRLNDGYLEMGDVRNNATNIEMYNGTAWVIIGP